MEPESEPYIEYRKLYGEACVIVNEPYRDSDVFLSLLKDYSGYVLYDQSYPSISHYVNGMLKNPTGWSRINSESIQWQVTQHKFYRFIYYSSISGVILDEIDGFSYSGYNQVIEISEDYKSWAEFEQTDKDFEDKLNYYNIKKEILYKVLTKNEISLYPKLPGMKEVIEGKVNFEYVVNSIE